MKTFIFFCVIAGCLSQKSNKKNGEFGFFFFISIPFIRFKLTIRPKFTLKRFRKATWFRFAISDNHWIPPGLGSKQAPCVLPKFFVGILLNSYVTYFAPFFYFQINVNSPSAQIRFGFVFFLKVFFRFQWLRFVGRKVLLKSRTVFGRSTAIFLATTMTARKSRRTVASLNAANHKVGL